MGELVPGGGIQALIRLWAAEGSGSCDFGGDGGGRPRSAPAAAANPGDVAMGLCASERGEAE